MKKYAAFGLLLWNGLYGFDFYDFDLYQYRLTKGEIEGKIEAYLEKEGPIRDFYSLTEDALYIGNLRECEIDYVLHLAKTPVPVIENRRARGLEKARIAIDPGHFGGALAKVEERYLEVPGEKIQYIKEGDLTYLTALKLKELLEAEGALVFITRSGIGKGAMGEDFFEWIEKSPSNFWHYHNIDLKMRAEKINAFSPDITVVIHYNIHDSGFVHANYNLAFIPGAFCRNDLQKRGDRWEFLRLIVTNQIEESLSLSREIVAQFTKLLNVPLIGEEIKTSYIDPFCLKQVPGVYSRNLALTRLVHSPICYGETLIQNDQEEFYRLSEKGVVIGGIPCSKRLEEVAYAYFEGIKSYFTSSD